VSIAKLSRGKKRQLGQFLTPVKTARLFLRRLELTKSDKVLEPSMGDGSFVLPLIELFMDLYTGSMTDRLSAALRNNVFGVEIDAELFARCLHNIEARWGVLPKEHNFRRCDFFRCFFGAVRPPARTIFEASLYPQTFDYVIGNPPFGGTLDPEIQDILDGAYGFRHGEKIKKETYSFFIVKSLDLLRRDGRLLFICSDTFLTIKTMRGLRRLLMSQGSSSISRLGHFSDETEHPTVVLDFRKDGRSDEVTVDGKAVPRDEIELTGNFSWTITGDLASCFMGPTLGEFVVATSGMTIGKNELFVREICGDRVREPYQFEFFDDPITLAKETTRARLGHVPPERVAEIRQLEAAGATRRNVRVVGRDRPVDILLPHPDYCYYNKAVNAIVYSPPTHVIFWKDNGDAVIVFKKNGNWYLHGVGGQPFFKREGLTWRLISDTLDVRYLPAGYILDSGAPCAFLRPDVAPDELLFIMAWAFSSLCGRLLKDVINHTRNIQSKDLERLPYPFWVAQGSKAEAVSMMKRLIREAVKGRSYSRDDLEIQALGQMFDLPRDMPVTVPQRDQELVLFDRHATGSSPDVSRYPFMTSDRLPIRKRRVRRS
jgi:hypothetical protein